MVREKKKRKEIKLFTLDTETRGLEGDVFRIGLFDGKQYYTGYTFADVLPVFEKYKDKECHVYIHNLDFDLSKIIKELRDYAEPSFNNSLFINGNIVTFTASHIILHDSFRLLPSSLENLCRDFELLEDGKKDIVDYMEENHFGIYNVKKRKLNHRLTKGNFFKTVDKDDEVLCEYMEYDCRSLYKILEIVLELSGLELEHFVKCPTTASLSKTVYKEQYKKDYKLAISTKQYNEKKLGRGLENFVRQGYYGGRTEVFTPRITNGYHYDVNSLYPYVMKNAEMPIGFPNILDGEEAQLSYDLWKRRKYGAGFIQAKVYVPENMYIPVLPKKDYTGKLIFPVGRIEGVWTFQELSVAESEGCVIEKIESGVVFEKTSPVFREFVSHFEQIKNTSRGAKRTFAKLMQNALYGKFAMQRERVMYADISDREKLEAEGHTVSKVIYNMNGIHMEFLEYDGYAMAEYIQPHISAYITSIARIILYKGLKYAEEKGILAYCDTDSIASTVMFPEHMVHDKEYGKWKLEGFIEEGLYFQPKMYAEKTFFNGKYKEVLRMKGVPKWVVNEQLDYNSFRKWYMQIKRGKTEIPIYKGGERVQKFLTKSKNNIEMNELAEMHKTINFAREQKRNIDYDKNVTSPLERHDYGEKKDEKATNQFDEWFEKLEEFNDDMSAIEELCMQHGKIQIPDKKARKLYGLYKEYSSKAKSMCFSNEGLPIQEWCEKTGWDMKELLGELSFL
ncbi:DNA polymerase [Bacillus sp. FSL L8-0637]|uniref:DNA polymerase n=1 Tax=Bacillus sp. FSL L8-0637 TaxID=2954753 RepID=UPI0030F62094